MALGGDENNWPESSCDQACVPVAASNARSRPSSLTAKTRPESYARPRETPISIGPHKVAPFVPLRAYSDTPAITKTLPFTIRGYETPFPSSRAQRCVKGELTVSNCDPV